MNPNGNTFVIHLKSGKSFQVSGAYKDVTGAYTDVAGSQPIYFGAKTQFVNRDQILMAEFPTESIEAIIVLA